MTIKLGSLFDGIGGFPLVASWYGIEPVWASEIEKRPIEITKKHFPNMKHLGDITKINGAEIEPVDIIAFGSPCQGLSKAGKGAGLKDERSGLFMHAVRIIREMRGATNNVFPKFAIWENVPGALSSNKGDDFRQVLQEISETPIPIPEGGKWADAGMVESPTCGIGWRCLDAQYWGVPQHRKRIFLVADYRSERRPEILFESESLFRCFTPCGNKRETFAGDSEDGIGERCQPVTVNHPSVDLQKDAEHLKPAVEILGGGRKTFLCAVENHPNDSRMKIREDGVFQTLSSRMGTGGGNVPMVLMGVDMYNQSLTGGGGGSYFAERRRTTTCTLCEMRKRRGRQRSLDPKR